MTADPKPPRRIVDEPLMRELSDAGNTPLDSHQLAKRYAKARDMTLKEFVNYCVKLYMDTTPLDPDAEPDLEYDGR